MSEYHGRLLMRPEPMRSSVARIRALDWTAFPREVVEPFLPGGSASLVVVTPAGGAMKMVLAGPATTAKYKRIVPAPFFVQLRLQPGSARAIFGVPLHELAGRVVEVEDIWGRAGAELLDALAPLEGKSRAVVSALEKVLLHRLDRAKPAADTELVRHATRALERGDASARGIAALARRLGVGERALRASFREHIGLSPKRYARIARIRRVVRRVGSTGLARLAVEHGFYDQAHLNAEFRALLRVAPRDFLARRFPLAPHR
jgi:AraC-like DNA-binding protein